MELKPIPQPLRTLLENGNGATPAQPDASQQPQNDLILQAALTLAKSLDNASMIEIARTKTVLQSLMGQLTEAQRGGELEKILRDFHRTDKDYERFIKLCPPPADKPKPKQSEEITKTLTSLGYTFVWNDLDDSIEVNGQRIDDGMQAKIRTEMRDRGFSAMEAIEDIYTTLAYANRYHPVKRALDSIKWDGGNHIGDLAQYITDDHLPIQYPNGEERSVFYVWLYRFMIGAIAKLYQAGAVRGQNPMLVLDGAQGMGKSALARWLASPFGDDLFIEEPIQPDNKEHARYLTTKFLWEVGELGSTTRRADRDALKAFVTKADSTYRKPYGRNQITKPALASFIGTINNENGFLTDKTGNRRFLSVTLKAIDWAYTKIDPAQLWAQAYNAYKNGQPWQLTPNEATYRDMLNGEYQVEDTMESWIMKVCEINESYADWRTCPTDWKTTSADIAQILQNAGVKGTTQAIQNGLGDTLRSMKLKQDTNARPRVWLGVRIKAFAKSIYSKEAQAEAEAAVDSARSADAARKAL